MVELKNTAFAGIPEQAPETVVPVIWDGTEDALPPRLDATVVPPRLARVVVSLFLRAVTNG